MSEPLVVWLLSPYHTGSHRAWAEAYSHHSRYRVDLLTMAGRFWKWRMQGGAVELAALARRRLADAGPPDVVVATDMVNLPAWLALMRGLLPSSTPVLVYMHENQLTYPWRPGEKPDLTYAMMNWLGQICADRVAFNSQYHMNIWFDEAPRLLGHFPDYSHLGLIDSVRRKSLVLPVGVDCDRILGEGRAHAGEHDGQPPRVLWNQRWEYDKRPDRFFELLYRLQAAGLGFRLNVAGENYRKVPVEFEEARTRLASLIEHWGYVPSYSDYVELLRRADLVISTADHEFFGVSMLEAIVAGAFPLAPNRLSYPELIAQALHPECLYDTADELFEKASVRLAHAQLAHARPAHPLLVEHVVQRYDWPVVARKYDEVIEQMHSGR